MIINRAWAMPNKHTFDIKPIRELILRYLTDGTWIDPFARNSWTNPFCHFTNDLSPDANTTHHLEALDFLTMLKSQGAWVGGCLFDPPYSPRQISECYQSVGREVHSKDTSSAFYGDRKAAVADLVKVGGTVISFGWNSGGLGKKHEFEIVEILLVAHGGAHNDTICTVEKKIA